MHRGGVGTAAQPKHPTDKMIVGNAMKKIASADPMFEEATNIGYVGYLLGWEARYSCIFPLSGYSTI